MPFSNKKTTSLILYAGLISPPEHTQRVVLHIRILVHRRKMSAHALLKMTRDLFRAMSLALRQKCRLR